MNGHSGKKETKPQNTAGTGGFLRRTAKRLGIGQLGRMARDARDRLLHPGRRRAALKVLHKMRPPRTLLFVCYGNIYRSPFAAKVFEDALPLASRERYAVSSAGFVGPDRPSPDIAVEWASRQGVDLSPHRSSLLTADRVGRADLILVMDESQKDRICEVYGKPANTVLILGDLDPLPITTRTIADPWGNDPAVLRASYERIRRCVKLLTEALIAGPKEPGRAG